MPDLGPIPYTFARNVDYLSADGETLHSTRLTEPRERAIRWSGGHQPLPELWSGVGRKVTFNGTPAVKLETTGGDSERVDAEHAELLAVLRRTVGAGLVQPELFDVSKIKGGPRGRPVDLRPEPRRIPRPSKTAFAGWVAWVSPATGEERRGIVSGGGRERTVIPADGGEMLPMRTRSFKDGVWQVKDGNASVPLRAVPGPAGEQDELPGVN
ncbi:hypothetical protein [Kitasatospora fiedleri]|uniref:hypothetical protein n=1 Tax=Kitasatospora fiedleri TaxID=2991545 RepID=UPI00249BBFA0|nr:hypothetical protein [Kitasatospora fiedleri]